MSTLFLTLLISTLVIDYTRGTCEADCDWSVGEWGECSRSCGGGHQARNRTRCCHDNESTASCLKRCQRRSIGDVPEIYRSCNKFCFNGGKFDEDTGQCRCSQGWTSTCCQEVSTSYKFTCISTRRTNKELPSQVADGPQSRSLSRVYVVKAHMPHEQFTKENYVPLDINIVIRLCSHHVYSVEWCTVDQISTYLNLLHNGTVIANERSGYLRDVSHVFLEVPPGDRVVEYNWIPEFLDVNGQYSHFHCSREVFHSQQYVPGRHRRWASRNLQIVIRTSGDGYAGTDATVSMIIYGEKGNSGSRRMSGSFEKRDVDTTNLSIDEIGRIRSIRIWHNDAGSYAGWKLDWVHIEELSEPGVKYEFGCNCWLEGSNNGKDLTHGTTSCRGMGSTVEMSLQWLSRDKQRCDLTCSYMDNRWCWPGSCSNGLMTSCSCESGFRKSGNSTCDITTKPDLLTCNVGIEDHRSDVRNSTSIGNTTDCYSQTDVYINIQPESMSFKITTEFHKKVLSTLPVFISRTYIGIVDSSLTVTRQDLSGTEHILSSTTLRGGGDCSKALSSSTPAPLVSCDRVLNGSSSLQNGEWLCGLIKVFSGGSFDYKNFHGDLVGNERFTALAENKTICFRYDNAAPVHCTTDSRFPCSSATPMRLSTRTTKFPNITVEVSGWIDPYPLRGSPEKASGVKYYQVDVYGVKHLDLNTLDVDYDNNIFHSTNLTGSSVNITVSLPSEPAMYVTYVEVHDVAGNVGYSRRFLLYDNSSELEVRTTKVLRVISASKDTRYTWQIHHGDILLEWNERYHNEHYINNNYFCHVKEDTDTGISGVYDQVTGILPVTGTVSINGITSFKYQWSLNNGSKTSWASVSDFTNQSLSLGLNLTDGESYEVWIEAQDIMLNTIVESVVVHIDRSVADIADTWLVRDGTSQVYVHNNTDLSTMVLQFRAWDVHSGITSVLWALGTTDAGSDLGNGALPVRKLDALVRCPRGPDCYCPSVGPCGFQNYTLDLGKTSLKANNTNTGQHNREYYFTLFITNGAMLKSFAHLDVLVDESPPLVGIVQEGSIDGPDIDYTSDGHVLISWRGFIDHESGIRYYIVGLADKCLSVGELKQTNSSDIIIQKATTESVSLVFPKEGRYFTSLVAVNNALEPSDVICSDGITFDLSLPIIENITLHQASSVSSLQCIFDQPWLINSNMTMARLPMVHVSRSVS
ncbi:uncharacterized protein LOC124271469 [Haliotis rubra]|uniref:uncharacterized protein LOC124271469 n=1 Tax=Haliotis rubra TaxID=36100 RepID=UPI001EE5EA35|nr:uncharacterized protein LOC124271469 [Haliotis rubra]